MIFDIEQYKGDWCMSVKTPEEDEIFRLFLAEKGRSWSLGDSYLEVSHWQDYKEYPIMYFNINKFGDGRYPGQAKILRFEDFEWDDPLPDVTGSGDEDLAFEDFIKAFNN